MPYRDDLHAAHETIRGLRVELQQAQTLLENREQKKRRKDRAPWWARWFTGMLYIGEENKTKAMMAYEIEELKETLVQAHGDRTREAMELCDKIQGLEYEIKHLLLNGPSCRACRQLHERKASQDHHDQD